MSTEARRRVVSAATIAALIDAAREYGTATVMFHGIVAERSGLSATDLKALDLLARAGPLTAGEIASHTGLATASVTSLIDRLEKKRLARRQRDKVDRRRVVVELTPRMQQTIAPLFVSLGRRMRARFRAYGEEQVDAVLEFLTKGARDMREEAAKLTEHRGGARAGGRRPSRGPKGRGGQGAPPRAGRSGKHRRTSGEPRRA